MRKNRVVTSRAPKRNLRNITIPKDARDAIRLSAELEDMRDVLLGRSEPPPGVAGPMALMEVADAYFGRACDMEQMILRMERTQEITPSSALSRFRKGELRSFKEQAKSACDLGSRRLTAENLRFEQERLGRESA